MASKWAKLKSKYETTLFNKEQAGDFGFQQRVEQLSREYGDLNLQALLTKHEEARKRKEEIAEQERTNNLQLAALALLLYKRFMADGVNSLHTDFGRTVYIEMEPLISVEEPSASKSFFLEHPETGVAMVPQNKSLTSWVKGMLDRDEDELVPKFLKVLLKATIKSKKT